MARFVRYPRKVIARLTDAQAEALDATSLATKRTTADIVRDAIDFYLAATPPPNTTGDGGIRGNGGRKNA